MVPIEWWDEPVAVSAAEVRRRHGRNRASWNQAAEAYAHELDATIALLAGGGSNLHPIERRIFDEHVGELRTWCRTAVHLQCASGRDTLSLLNEGVERVVGVDIAELHVGNARAAAEALGVTDRARFIRADVLDTPSDLDGGADLVYTGRGALAWLHDLPAWGRVVARLLAPGGWLLVYDEHPASYLFDPGGGPPVYNGSRYFGSAASGTGWGEEFLDDAALTGDLVAWHGRYWTIEEHVAAVVGAGLHLAHLGEWAVDYATPADELPDEGKHGPIPRSLSLLARRPR